MFIDDRDQMDPRATLTAEDRAWLRRSTPALLAKMQDDLMVALGLDEDARWLAETGRNSQGFTPNEWDRFVVWKTNGGDVQAAQQEWTSLTRGIFVKRLISGGRIGLGDEVMTRG
jgi:hypothetical protein